MFKNQTSKTTYFIDSHVKGWQVEYKKGNQIYPIHLMICKVMFIYKLKLIAVCLKKEDKDGTNSNCEYF
jgi:hypothetical protein